MLQQLNMAFALVVAFVATFLLSLAICDHGVSHHRTYLYVGGHYALNSDGEHVFTDKMYVEKLTPAAGVSKPYPLVFIHGAAQTGTVRYL